MKNTEAQLLAKRSDYKPSHILHLFLSIITGGFWIPVWILVCISHGLERKKIDFKLSRLEQQKQ